MSEPEPVLSFAELGLGAELALAAQNAGYLAPTPVQVAAIAGVLAGRDVLARAETGSGKTAAFGLPILQLLGVPERPARAWGNHVAVLVLSPTRELAIQIGGVLTDLAAGLPWRPKILVAHGGVKINPQMMALRGGADVLVATPGRLLDLHRSNAVKLDTLSTLVLDEADRLLGLGFSEEVSAILAMLPERRQNLLFSATFPDATEHAVRALVVDPIEVDIEPAAEAVIEEHVYTVDRVRKNAVLIHLIKSRKLRQVLVFVSAKRTGNGLVRKLIAAGIRSAVLNGDQSQAERNRNLGAFRAGSLTALIATDVAARGIDIEQLPAVANFELPRSPNDYIHRIGRTGRAGHPGLALSIICHAEYAHFRVIERRIARRLPRESLVGFEASAVEPEEPPRPPPRRRAPDGA